MNVPVLKRFKKQAVGLLQGVQRTFAGRTRTSDRIHLNLWGLNLAVTRDTSLDTPTEMSVIIPRVEFRQKYGSSPEISGETEIIFNSITVVLSPRHPSEQEPADAPIPGPVPGVSKAGGIRIRLP